MPNITGIAVSLNINGPFTARKQENVIMIVCSLDPLFTREKITMSMIVYGIYF